MLSLQCFFCKRLSTSKNKAIVCDAFKNGVPVEILTGEHDHTKPYKGDNGIVFEKIKEDE